jgi:tetratricopeptide (TPR) repeat protein
MNVERIKLLEQFCEENPNDPFNLYALALEYQLDDTKKATLLFEKLLHDFPEYLPTYYQAVDFFGNQNEFARAIEIAKQGIEKAKLARENKTLGELRSLLESIDE